MIDDRKMLLSVREQRDRAIYENGGVHKKHIPYIDGTCEYVRMFRQMETENLIVLYSLPFSSAAEAQHFADCFYDSFLYPIEVMPDNSVMTEWMEKVHFASYRRIEVYEYYQFANWS